MHKVQEDERFIWQGFELNDITISIFVVMMDCGVSLKKMEQRGSKEEKKNKIKSLFKSNWFVIEIPEKVNEWGPRRVAMRGVFF